MFNPRPRRSFIERDWQRALFIPLTILAWLAVLLIGVWLLSHVLKTVLTIVLGAILAFALTPLVSYLRRFMPRGLAIAVAYLLGFAVIFGLLSFVVATAANQITYLVGHLEQYKTRASSLEPQIVHVLSPFGVTPAKYNLALKQGTAYLQTAGTSIAGQSLGIVTSVLDTIVSIVLVLILSVYLTANGDRIGAFLRREAPEGQRGNTALLIAIVNQVVGGYIRGTLTMATLIGLLVYVGMAVLHVPYAILLGILAFFMEFIPVVGVLVSGAVCVAVALTQGWLLAVIVLGYFVVVHVIEGDVVGPRVMGRAVGIHPATALIALVAGTELFGVWGALFGSPLAGLLQAIGTAVWLEMRGDNPRAVLQGAEQAGHDLRVVADREAEKEVDEVEQNADAPPAPEPRVGTKRP